MDGTGRMFRPLVDHLPKEWDIRGVSYPSNQALSYDQLVIEASRSIPSEGTYFLLGESFSGPIAIRLAETADARLKGVILCCTFMHAPLHILRYFGGLLSKYPISLIPSFAIEKLLFGRFRSVSLSSLLKEALGGVSNTVLSQRILEIRDVNVSSQLKTLHVPLTYLRATEDWIVGPEESLAMAKVADHMSIVEVIGPHCLLQASPDLAGEIITKFVRENRGENGSNQ
jgi:pimeloyl-ACP methyl ester carboxylesterase